MGGPPAECSVPVSASGAMKGLADGTRSSCSVCAKKHTRRRQRTPSLHSCVRYLRAGRRAR